MDSRIIAELVLHLARITSAGTCASCEHLEGDGCCGGQAPYACGSASEPLLLGELGELCIYFVPGKPTAMKDAVTGAASR
jgi:hypothetical protein